MQHGRFGPSTLFPDPQPLMFAIAPDQRVRSILVIDDEPQIRRAVRNALAPLSEHVLEAQG